MVDIDSTGGKVRNSEGDANRGIIMLRMIDFQNEGCIRHRSVLNTFHSKLITSQMKILKYHLIFQNRTNQGEVESVKTRDRREINGIKLNES